MVQNRMRLPTNQMLFEDCNRQTLQQLVSFEYALLSMLYVESDTLQQPSLPW
jgi:hypothetical protein